MRQLNTQPCAKWELSTNPVKFIGHVISSRRIKADPKKLQVITDLPPPQNVQKRVLLEASIVRVRSDDTHRNQNRAGREGSSSSAMGVRAIMGIHRGEVNHYGNGHRSLVPLLSTHILDQLPPPIQRFKIPLIKTYIVDVISGRDYPL